ncbi:hypothetical protein CFOL_v3_29952 [Cephalotus follicularis]|uniref:Uncharacterized protein n=1 Tax=Cephalotus follicularis TaxID=3775 RepID=A0A1Q3D254_CEPFO|nr:hypothetical protein CFOL_v3_29952 [Cephalotus follicularis]
MVGPPRNRLVPFLILSLSALFLYTHYHSSLPLLSTPPRIDLNPQFTPHTNPATTTTPTFTLIIKVLAYNRLPSLSRCLRSLANAHYHDEPVHLHLYIDHFAIGDNDTSKKLEDSNAILDLVDGFEWKFGNKMVHYRTNNVGLQSQWLEAWWPSSDDEFVFVVEDDLEVSPLFYNFLRTLILNYHYNHSNFSPYIYGASLQRPRFVPGKHGNKIHVDSKTRVFLYQLVGTWGQLLFPKPWKEFRLWYDKHKSMGIKPVIDGMVTTGWYNKLGEKIWTPWFIKFIHSRGYFNMYTNFLHERALSVSHRDAGVNYGKTAGPDSQLLDETPLDFNLLEKQPLSNLKWYDFCFREVVPGRVVKSLDGVGSVLRYIQKDETVLLVSLFGASEAITRNLLCHFERIKIRNYILMGPHSDFLFDFARRGHPVVDVDQLFNSIRANKSMEFQRSNAKLMKEVLVKAYIIKKCLEFSYHSLLVDGNILFVDGGPFIETVDSAYDFYATRSLELFFVRSSSSSPKIWGDDFLNKVASMVDKVALPKESRNFLYIVRNVLEQKGARIKRVEETSFGTKISMIDVNRSSLGIGKKMVYWSAEMGLDIIQKELEKMSLWVVDGDLSCMAVVCNQS